MRCFYDRRTHTNKHSGKKHPRVLPRTCTSLLLFSMCVCVCVCVLVEIKMNKRITAELLLPTTNHRRTSKPLAVSNIVIVGKFRQRLHRQKKKLWKILEEKGRTKLKRKRTQKPLTNCTAGKIVIFALINDDDNNGNGPKCTCCCCAAKRRPRLV